ncbi:hypothetical protein MNB_SV-5-249 [hydrothermal vent metagenome]|uniref:Uncharacterized protein n=1 Tax=hydrothermal vent metagenome TaxID=652676 RepID=A0A1W1EBA8_9ZZZZ
MDKSLMIFIAIGLGALYLVTNFVGDIQAEDDAYKNSGYQQEHIYDKYQTTDSVGQDILDVTGADVKTQLGAWNSSLLKDEFLDLFPDFTEMKNFINDRIRGKILQDKLTKKVTEIEDKFFSGGITAEDAKRGLSTLK